MRHSIQPQARAALEPLGGAEDGAQARQVAEQDAGEVDGEWLATRALPGQQVGQRVGVGGVDLSGKQKARRTAGARDLQHPVVEDDRVGGSVVLAGGLDRRAEEGLCLRREGADSGAVESGGRVEPVACPGRQRRLDQLQQRGDRQAGVTKALFVGPQEARDRIPVPDQLPVHLVPQLPVGRGDAQTFPSMVETFPVRIAEAVELLLQRPHQFQAFQADPGHPAPALAGIAERAARIETAGLRRVAADLEVPAGQVRVQLAVVRVSRDEGRGLVGGAGREVGRERPRIRTPVPGRCPPCTLDLHGNPQRH